MLVTTSYLFKFDEELGSSNSKIAELFGGRGIYTSPVPVVLDPQNTKVHTVPGHGGDSKDPIPTASWRTESEAGWSSGDMDGQTLHDGMRMTTWAYFPTPEDDIDTVSVTPVPGDQSVSEVPINWEKFEPAKNKKD